MRKEYFNALANNPRYKKLLILMSVFVLVMVSAIVIYYYKDLENKKSIMKLEKFEVLEKNYKKSALVHISLGIITIAAIFIIARFRQQERIFITTEGVEYSGMFKKLFIPWEEVKELKILLPGTGMEKCMVKGKENNITFTAFFLDSSISYTYSKNGILDEHNQPVSNSVKKGRLYKEIKMRMKT